MLSNYAELQTTIADFLNRDDLTGFIPTFIRLGEVAIDRDLRHWRMESRQVTETADQYLERPEGWLETIALRVMTTNGPQKVRLLSNSDMDDRRLWAASTPGTPLGYIHTSSAFEFVPAPDGTYEVELRYFERIPRLSDAAPSNWLMDEAPDLYLYSALLHTAPYLQHDERLQTWVAMAGSVMQALNTSSRKARESGTGHRMRKRGGP